MRTAYVAPQASNTNPGNSSSRMDSDSEEDTAQEERDLRTALSLSRASAQIEEQQRQNGQGSSRQGNSGQSTSGQSTNTRYGAFRSSAPRLPVNV